MENVKTEIKQIKLQILLGIKQDKIDRTWGMLIVDNCCKALTLCGVVVSETELLCVDSKDANWLTTNEKYTLIDEEKENYLVKGDEGFKNWYSKNMFEII